ncbi:PepSY domain-containing protein [Aquimarina spongiae]|uniref:Methionine synthase reductase n=1 Tax=Aquimarina spongiae TaxID=570521 RepID=A0A1M6IZY0_9FLAO|nr:PepSY domain-containing protein [Aquimarina spongiae]SHJ40008.1 sulfite reductase (NADPH) flavoprotein alpha-component [Aquimarina spongiae]
MTISIWRYSHLVLAISSSLFLGIASITGIILAFEPISDSIHSYAIEESKTLTLSETITTLKENYEEVISFEIDANDALLASVITYEGKSETIYINPLTGKKLGTPTEKAAIFKFATNLHRSLFLKSIGRFFVGLISFLLIIIAITGILLILKRQGGIRKFFGKIEKEYFSQYYHIVFGRLFLIPVLIVAITGVYLSLERFSVLPKPKISHQIEDVSFTASPKLTIQDFEIFKTTQLKNVRAVEFPFSEAEEDYFLLKLSDKEVIVNQFTGAIISQQSYPFVAFVSSWSSILHTGQGNVLWSIILLLSSCSILFFMYSGFAMTLKRRKNLMNSNLRYSKDESEYIILVGSETGSTFKFANLFANALSASGKTVFVSELNKYSLYKKAKHLIIFTATYGVGEPPTNAKKFTQLFNTLTPIHPLQYAVVGLGSLAYPDFCKYATDIDQLLQTNSKFEPILDPYKINNQSFTAFKNWVSDWSQQTQIPLEVKTPPENKKIQLDQFTVINRTELNSDDTFLLRLRLQSKVLFESGDLLAFYPKEDSIERLYSIAKIDGDILLSVKKHEFGVCSNYLSQLHPNEQVEAIIQPNPDFHYPERNKDVIMISNGTGIAPFLGMLDHHSKANHHLFWGGRTQDSITMYADFIARSRKSKHYFAYSQEEKDKEYVQDVLQKQSQLVSSVLNNNGIIMICGSVAMQKEVIAVLEEISETQLGVSLSHFQQKNQVLMDCY